MIRPRGATRVFAGLALSLIWTTTFPDASAQTPPVSPAARAAKVQKTQTDVELQTRANSNTVMVVSGSLNGTFARIASDLSTVLDDGAEMRVLAMLGKGALQNLKDVFYLRGVDIGIVRSDTLPYFERTGEIPNLRERIRYITGLFYDEVHLLVRQDITSIEQLRGQIVNFDQLGSGANVVGTLLFEALNIPVQSIKVDAATGIEKLKAGEIAATLDVVSKPSKDFQLIAAEAGLRLLPIPYEGQLKSIYFPAELNAKDYPNLIPADSTIWTLAVPSLLAVYNLPPKGERYKRVAKFTELFFAKFDQFHKAPRHPKWKDVDISADVAGWTRFPPAEEALRKLGLARSDSAANDAALRADFETFLKSTMSDSKMSEGEQNAMFERFLRWRSQPGQTQTR